MRKCSVDNCDRPYRAKGYCGAHYQRHLRHGDPLAGGTWQGECQSFFDKLLSSDTDECINWPYAKTSDGYGAITIDGKCVNVHRQLCFQRHGKPKRKSLDAAHSCGNAWCVNPKHIRWDSKAENSRDRFRHGSMKTRLTPDSVKQVRKLLREGLSAPTIARQFGVSNATIYHVKYGLSWRWVK